MTKSKSDIVHKYFRHSELWAYPKPQSIEVPSADQAMGIKVYCLW